jgi:hypothetical protein
MDLFIIKICLDFSILAKSIMDQKKYKFLKIYMAIAGVD